ncbi:uncharacterized protein [Eschrichtius robustus]|uniref:uncharacterized protein n=1 Tax=Eschrichtius robustus TaxID=9764 RepID=UPI0035C1D92B
MPKVRDGYALSCNHSVNSQRGKSERGGGDSPGPRRKADRYARPSRGLRSCGNRRGRGGSLERSPPPAALARHTLRPTAPPRLHLRLRRRPPPGARDAFPAPRSTAEKSALKGQRAGRPTCGRAEAGGGGRSAPGPRVSGPPPSQDKCSPSTGGAEWRVWARGPERGCRGGAEAMLPPRRSPRAGRCHRKGSAGARWGRRIPVFQSFPGDSRRQPPIYVPRSEIAGLYAFGTGLHSLILSWTQKTETDHAWASSPAPQFPQAPLWLSMALLPAHRLKQTPNHNCYLTTTFLSH